MEFKSQNIHFTQYANGASLQIIYTSSDNMPDTPSGNDPQGWSTQMPAIVAGEKVYMSQKLSSDTNWSTPVPISANDGNTPTVTISNGYWVINGEPTSQKAQGEDGLPGSTPEVTIVNGEWVINGVPTGQQAQGAAGKDGSDIEYVYYRSIDEQSKLQPPSASDINALPETITDEIGGKWYESPLGITSKWKYEYMSVRTKPSGTQTNWSNFSTPVIWSKWGEKGQDGDGVSYYYLLTETEGTYNYTIGDEDWTDEPTGVNNQKKYEYVVKVTYDGKTNTTTIGNPATLWNRFVSSMKQMNTYTYQNSYNNWTTPQGTEKDAYVAIGHRGKWYTDQVVDGKVTQIYDNSDLKAGDMTFLEGEVTDRYSSDNVCQRFTLYGTVIAVKKSDQKVGDANNASKRGYVEIQNTAITWGGVQGASGKAIGSVTEYYARSKAANNKPTSWDTKLESPNKEWPYLWNYEVVTYDDGTPASTTEAVVIAYYTEDGAPGRGIEKVQNYYLINSGTSPDKPSQDGVYSEAPATPTGGIWYTTPPKTSITHEYLWNCEILTYNKEPFTVITDPAIIGTHGSSPYTLSLSEDFISVPAANNGTVAEGDFPDTTLTLTTFYGNESQNFGKQTTAGLGLFINETSGLEYTWDTANTVVIKGFKGEVNRGTIKFALKKDGVEVASASFEAIKQKAGADGPDGQYVYALCDYDEIKIGSFPSQLTVLMQKRTGSGSPANYTGTIYYKVSIDGKNFGNVTQKSLSTGQFTISKSEYSSATKSVRINICSDAACSIYIDKLTISVLKDGNDGDNGDSIYVLYHDKADTTPSKPSEKDYTKFPNESGWYKDLTYDSVFMCQKVCKPEAQATTNWGAVTRISGVMSTKTDLFGLLEDGDGIVYDGGKIGINASAIKTGAISVGNPPTFDDDGNLSSLNGNKFYADIDQQRGVYVGGWEVKEDMLSSGNVGMYSGDGKEDSMYLQSLVNSSETSPLRFFAGKETDAQGNVSYNFAALDDGSVYMQAAQIGENCLLTDGSGSKQTVGTTVVKIGELKDQISGAMSSLNRQLQLYEAIIEEFLGRRVRVGETAYISDEQYLYAGQEVFAGRGEDK